MSYPFNVRVYGLLQENDHLLVMNELVFGEKVVKFPGGGLEYGEGILACLARELKEELHVELSSAEHFYTTDFFIQSQFHAVPNQVISVYYRIKLRSMKNLPAPGSGEVGIAGSSWLCMQEMTESAVTLPIDKVVLKKLLGE